MAKKVDLNSTDFESRLSTKHEIGTARIGFDERVHRWNHMRALVVQALIADPDILLYFKCVSSKLLARELAEFHGILCAIVEGVQELIDTVSVKVKVSSTDTAQSLISRSLAGEDISIALLQKEVAKVVRDEATAGIRNKRRNTVTSVDAIEALLVEARRRDTLLKQHIASILSAEVLTRGLTQVAEIPVLQKLSQTLSSEPSFSRALEASSSIGALTFCRRKISLRNKIEESQEVPVSFSSLRSGSTVILSQPANLLGIEVGDVISAGASSSTVLSILDKVVTMDSALPAGPIQVERGGHTQFKPIKNLLTTLIGLSSKPLYLPLNIQNRPSAANFCKEIATMASAIGSLTQDARVSASRLGIALTGGTLLNEMYAAQFTFNQETVESARNALRILREEGFRNAADLLSRGDYGILQSTDPRVASSQAGSVLGQYGGFVERLRETL